MAPGYQTKMATLFLAYGSSGQSSCSLGALKIQGQRNLRYA